MPRRLRAGESKGPKNSLVKLSKKVNKNTRMIGQREIGRIRVVMDTTPDTTAVVQNLAPLPQGDDVDERHGRQVHAEQVLLSGTVFKHSTSIFTRVHMIIVIDKQGSSTPPTITDVYGSEQDFFVGAPRRETEFDLKRFRIIWDKFIVLNENFDGQNTCVHFKMSKKLNHNMNFTGTGATDEGKNSIWLMTGSDEATNVPSVNGEAVFRFTDP